MVAINDLADAATLAHLGENSNKLGQYKKATRYYYQSLARFNDLKNWTHMVKVLVLIGRIYTKRDKYYRAQEIYGKAISICKSNNLDPKYLVIALYELGLLRWNFGSKTRACEVFHHSLKLDLESPFINEMQEYLATRPGPVQSRK